MRTLSVVIPNYNYARFVGAAVQSALNIEWPDVEVIVVDDGSTDNSIAVLKNFGDHITVVQQPNAGPRVACNTGFAISRGDAVLFLDSDDQAEPSIASEVSKVWGADVSKVQVQMQRIDQQSRKIGRAFPRFSPRTGPDRIRRWISETGAYPTPPGSGNIYARSFLQQLFPLDDSCGDATDSATLAAAPFLGDVITVRKPLVLYRVHDDNRSKLKDSERFTRQVERAYLRQEFALRIAGLPHDREDVVPTLRRGRHLLQMRVAENRLNGGARPPVPADSKRKMMIDTLRSPFAPGPEPLWERLAVALWCTAALLAPPLAARHLVRHRFGWNETPGL